MDRELEREYGRHFVAQSLTVGNGLTKAVEKDKTIADIVVEAKAPSSAWKILKSIVEDDISEKAREQAKKNFEGLSMCARVFFLPIYSGHEVCWTYQPESHRRKVTQYFSSTFLLRCVP